MYYNNVLYYIIMYYIIITIITYQYTYNNARAPTYI